MRVEKHCGSLREHDEHEWTTPNRVWVGEVLSRVTYVCVGPPVVEGGNIGAGPIHPS